MMPAATLILCRYARYAISLITLRFALTSARVADIDAAMMLRLIFAPAAAARFR